MSAETYNQTTAAEDAMYAAHNFLDLLVIDEEGLLANETPLVKADFAKRQADAQVLCSRPRPPRIFCQQVSIFLKHAQSLHAADRLIPDAPDWHKKSVGEVLDMALAACQKAALGRNVFAPFLHIFE